MTNFLPESVDFCVFVHVKAEHRHASRPFNFFSVCFTKASSRWQQSFTELDVSGLSRQIFTQHFSFPIVCVPFEWQILCYFRLGRETVPGFSTQSYSC